MQTLIERLGGPEGLERIIENAYERVLANEELSPFFENSDTQRLRRMQLVFLEAALTDGTDEQDAGKSIRAAHQNRGITRHHFSLFTNCFLDAMEALGDVDQDDIDQVIGRLNTYADDVLGSSTVDG